MNRNCNIELLEKYFDNELTKDEKLLVEDHLKSCLICQYHLKGIERLGEMIKRPVDEATEREDFSLLWNKIERQLKPRVKPWETIISLLDISYIFKKKVLIPAIATTAIILLVLIPLTYKKDTSISNRSVVEYVESKTHNIMIYESEKDKITVIWLFEEKMRESPNS